MKAEFERRKTHIIREVTGAVPPDRELPEALAIQLCHRLNLMEESKRRPLTVGELKIILGDWPDGYVVRIVKNRLMVGEPKREPLVESACRFGTVGCLTDHPIEGVRCLRARKEQKRDSRKAVSTGRRRSARGPRV
jgi:hypothetical protein